MALVGEAVEFSIVLATSYNELQIAMWCGTPVSSSTRQCRYSYYSGWLKIHSEIKIEQMSQ